MLFGQKLKYNHSNTKKNRRIESAFKNTHSTLVQLKKTVIPIDFNTRWWCYLYSYGTEAPFHTSAWRVNSKLGSHLAQGTWKVLKGFGGRRCQRQYGCREGRGVGGGGGGSDSVSNRQSYLPCKSAFINATFVSKNNRKGKGKVDRLLVEHWDISDGATERHRASRQGGGRVARRWEGDVCPQKEPEGETMEWRQNCNGSSPKWHRQYGVKNMQSLSHSKGLWPIRFVMFSQVITNRRACNGDSLPPYSMIGMMLPSDSLSSV